MIYDLTRHLLCSFRDKTLTLPCSGTAGENKYKPINHSKLQAILSYSFSTGFSYPAANRAQVS